MIVFLLVLSTIFLACSAYFNVYVIRKNLQLSDQREEIVDQVEISLDMLEGCYVRLSHNAEISVLSDEPVIREVLADIKRAKNAVCAIASKVVVYDENKGAEEGE